jgi:hypothetical protein
VYRGSKKVDHHCPTACIAFIYDKKFHYFVIIKPYAINILHILTIILRFEYKGQKATIFSLKQGSSKEEDQK